MTSARALGSLGHLPRHTRLPFCRTATEVSLIDTSNPTYCSMAALPGDRALDRAHLTRRYPRVRAAAAPPARPGAGQRALRRRRRLAPERLPHVALRRSEGVQARAGPATAARAAGALRPDLPPPHRVRHPRPAARPAAREQGR